MANEIDFFNLDDLSRGIPRELGPGLSTRIFVGDKAMLSIVTIAPNAQGNIHSHPEEQWGFMLAGDGVRIQGGREVKVKVGDFWRTPGGTKHGFQAGPNGARLLDVFSPPRAEYRKSGSGFAGS